MPWNGKSNRVSRVTISPGQVQVHTVTALCIPKYYTVRSQDVVLLTLVVAITLLSLIELYVEYYLEMLNSSLIYGLFSSM